MTDAELEARIVVRLKSQITDCTIKVVDETRELTGEQVGKDVILVLYDRSAYNDPGKGASSMNAQERTFNVAIAVATKTARARALEMLSVVRTTLGGWQYDGGYRLWIGRDQLVTAAREYGAWMYQVTAHGKQEIIMEPPD